jgi:trehalose 6-phosphate synthase/phosphatase
VAWNKGRAALLLTQRLKHPYPVIIGDDATDEYMFRAFRGRGVTVVVGRTKSSARWRIARQSDVPRFLESICETREQRRK